VAKSAIEGLLEDRDDC
jgi:hypothetical protein